MDDLVIIAVDFDGVLVTDEFPLVGKPIWGNIIKVITAQKAGCKTILWTCRVGDKLDDAVKFCESNGLKFDAVNDNVAENKEEFGNNPRKVFAHIYIDDRSVERVMDTLPGHYVVPDFLRRIRTWLKAR